MAKTRILICGILPPPNFGHSMLYKGLMQSSFVDEYEVEFFNMTFWSYGKHKKITFMKILKMVKYLFEYQWLIISKRPQYILYSISFDKMPFLKDYLFCLIGRIYGCRIVIHDMGQYIKELYDSASPRLRIFIKKFSKMVTASIVLGERTKEKYKGFIDQERLFSAPCAADDSREIYDLDEMPVDKNEAIIKVLYFSFMSRTKGVMTGIEAVPEVIKVNPNIRFTFAGPVESQELKDEINEFIDENNMRDYVEFIGYVEGEKERTYQFRNADIFIFPTLRDVFGIVLLHAMAEGVPIVASMEGTIPEIVIDKENGLLFPKGDHKACAQNILVLAQDKELRENMAKANRQRFEEHYLAEHYGKRMIKVFKKIEGNLL